MIPIYRVAHAVVVLLVLAGSAEPALAQRVSITDAGALPDGATVNTKAIQSLIDRLATEGGGTVVIPPGTFLTGSLFFKQGVNLHLEKDGALQGTTNMDDYAIIPSRWEGIERQWVAALVNFIDMTDVKLTGEGTIHGSGDTWFGGRGRRGGEGGAARGGPATQPAGQRGFARGPTSQPNGLPGYARPRLIAIQNCKNVTISGINMRHQSSWGLFVLYSEGVLIENLNILAARYIPSSDGIDIDSSRRVRVTGCWIDVNDDCIAIKSGKDEDGRRVNRPAEDIIVEKTTLAYGHGGVSMGSEVSGGIRNVEIRDCIIDNGNWAPIRFKSQPSRGGVVENITYRNIEIRDARDAFEFNMAWRMVNPAPAAPVLTKVRNVKIINVKGTANSVGVISGLGDSPIDGVTFENCEITASRSGLRISNAINVDLSGLKINVPEGVEPVIIRNPTAVPAQ